MEKVTIYLKVESFSWNRNFIDIQSLLNLNSSYYLSKVFHEYQQCHNTISSTSSGILTARFCLGGWKERFGIGCRADEASGQNCWCNSPKGKLEFVCSTTQ